MSLQGGRAFSVSMLGLLLSFDYSHVPLSPAGQTEKSEHKVFPLSCPQCLDAGFCLQIFASCSYIKKNAQFYHPLSFQLLSFLQLILFFFFYCHSAQIQQLETGRG